MIDTTPSPTYSASAKAFMKSFINNRDLNIVMAQKGLCSLDRIIFVSFCEDDGFLLLMLVGSCLLCQSQHIRNLSNQKYVDKCALPIFKLIFPFIRMVIIMRLNNHDIYSIVEDNGGRVMTIGILYSILITLRTFSPEMFS